MPKVFEPFNIGSLELKNRIVGTPLVDNCAAEDGFVNQRVIDLYATRAKGGWGMITISGSYPSLDGKGFSRQIGIDHDNKIPSLKELAGVIHEYGVRASIQLMHCGPIAGGALRFTGVHSVSPSGIPEWRGIKPQTLATKEVEAIIDAHAEAARRAKEADFDAVNIHAAHGYLISSFLSPYTNKRSDKYGDRMKFLLEIVEKMREAVGNDFPIIVRFSADEMHHEIGIEGYRLEYTLNTIVPALEKAGVDCLDVSLGTWIEHLMNCVPSLYSPRGCMIFGAEAVKKITKLPVIGVGRINDPRFVEKLIVDGKVDLVAVGRQQFADPEFPNKMREGRYDDIRRCLACGTCENHVGFQYGVKCSVNACLGRERDFIFQKTESSKNVVVVGGGVGGMEAARVASLRGHKVTLYEKSERLGGLTFLAASTPRLNTRELNNIILFLKKQLEKLSVSIILGKEITAEDIKNIKPEVLIIATGSLPEISQVPGINKPHVIHLYDYLLGKKKLGNKVIVWGGIEGAEAAVSLAREGKEVTIIEESQEVAYGSYVGFVRGACLRKYIKDEGIKVLTGVKVTSIEDSEVVIIGREGKKEILTTGAVVIAKGRKSNRDLADRLRSEMIQIYEIGDCLKPRGIMHAIHEGARIASVI